MMKRAYKKMSVLLCLLIFIIVCLALFMNGTKSGSVYMIDTEGKPVSDKGCYGCDTINENGFVSVTYENRWPKWTPFYRLKTGVIGSDGNFVIKPKYYKSGKARLYMDSFSVGTDEGAYTQLFLDDKGISYRIPEDIWVHSDKATFGIFPFCNADPYHEKTYGYMTTDGEILAKPVYRRAMDFTDDGLAAVMTQEGLCGYVGRDGNLKIEAKYKDASSFSEGLAYTDQGYIDIHGNVVIDGIYAGKSFSEGFARVSDRENGAWRYIDKSGNAITEYIYGHGSGEFENGFARVEGTGELAGKYGFIDTNGNTVIEMQFADAGNFSKEGIAPVKTEDGLWGYIKTDGNWYIEPQYLSASDFKNGVAMIYKK